MEGPDPLPPLLGLQVEGARLQEVAQGDEPHEAAGIALDHRESRDPGLRHAIGHHPERLVGMDHRGLGSDEVAETRTPRPVPVPFHEIQELGARGHALQASVRATMG